MPLLLLWGVVAAAFLIVTYKLPGFSSGNVAAVATPTVESQLPDWLLTPTTMAPAPTTSVLESASTPVSLAAPPITNPSPPVLYYAQAGDSLTVVARRFGVEPGEITSPNPIPEETMLTPGILLIIPDRLSDTTSTHQLLPDSEVVFSPSAVGFDIEEFVQQAGGHLKDYREWLGSTGWTSGAEIIRRVALENSINPRLLLSLLEYQSGWVYGQPGNLAQDNYPMGLIDYDQRGLYHQIVWAVNRLSIGYYGWREGRLFEIVFTDGVSARLSPDLNAGTAALQYYFAQLYGSDGWGKALRLEDGYPALHERMFGNPWLRAQTVEPLFPAGLTQPPLILPFLRGQMWAFTGGPHGAWERDGAWAALDFAPGSISPGCFESDAWVTAIASGQVVRSERGIVIIDLDGDGYEQTGWAILYLHLAEKGRIRNGMLVEQGDILGHPSCEGGMATGTHIHIARKYNGEWIPADGSLPFNLGGWIAHSSGQAYKGYLTRDSEKIQASDLGLYATRIVRAKEDP